MTVKKPTRDMPVLVESRCTRSRHAHSTCTRCAEACPADALQAREGGPGLVVARCIACGVCTAACPQDALLMRESLTAAPLKGCRRFVCRQAGGEDTREGGEVVPSQTVPCLLALGDEVLLMSALFHGKDPVTLVSACCSECLGEEIGGRIESKLSVVEKKAADLGITLHCKRIQPRPRHDESRRLFWSRLIGGTQAGPLQGSDQPVREALKRIQQEPAKRVPDSRRMSVAVLRVARGRNPACADRLLGGLLPAVDADKCCTCTLCTAVCPTGALTLSYENRTATLRLDGAACSGCGLCADLCVQKAVHLEPVTVDEALSSNARVLASGSLDEAEFAEWEDKLSGLFEGTPVYRT